MAFKRTCECTTNAGTKCSRPVEDDSTRCWQHKNKYKSLSRPSRMSYRSETPPKATARSSSPSPVRPSKIPRRDPQMDVSLLDNIRAVTFDFDCTTLKKHSCSGIPLTSATVERVPIGDLVADLELFKNTIDNLVALGKSVAILSYGRKEIILAVMGKIWNSSSPFNADNVITPADITNKYELSPPWKECFNNPVGYSKNNMLELLQERLAAKGEDAANSEIVLIDDDMRNALRASQAGYYGVAIPAAACAGYNRNLEAELDEVAGSARGEDLVQAFSTFLERRHV